MDLVSIIIPYNINRGWLNKAIQSAKSQTYKNIQLIIQQGNYNSSKNINNGIKKSSGQYIKLLGEDDWLPNDSIENLVNGIKDNDFIHGNAINYRQDTKKEIKVVPPIKIPNINQMIKRNGIHGGAVLYTRKIFQKNGYFNQELNFAQQYQYHLRAISNNLKLGYVDKFVYYYRTHNKQKAKIISSKQKIKRKELIQTIKKKYIF